MSFYSPQAVELARDFILDNKGSYGQLATYLDLFAPRSENWTLHSAYHLCRSHGIRSVRRSRAQPASARTRRTRGRAKIIKATLEALATVGRPLADIAPFSPKEITQLSGASPYSVKSNWRELETELNKLAGL